jgi:hypothetical protein
MSYRTFFSWNKNPNRTAFLSRWLPLSVHKDYNDIQEMKDLQNPSQAEIKKWAYQPTKKEPTPVWSLTITTIENGELLVALASDPACPRKHYFLRCLYFLVGESVSKHREEDKGRIEELLTKADASEDPQIIQWVLRSRSIIKDLRKFDYKEWCEGGFAIGSI